MTLESKKILPVPEEDSQIPDNIIAKVRNDPEFSEASEEQVSPELFAAFVAKQIVNNDFLKRNIEQHEKIQAEKKQQLAYLNEKLTKIQFLNKSETEDSTPRSFKSPNLKDPQYWQLEKLKKK